MAAVTASSCLDESAGGALLRPADRGPKGDAKRVGSWNKSDFVHTGPFFHTRPAGAVGAVAGTATAATEEVALDEAVVTAEAECARIRAAKAEVALAAAAGAAAVAAAAATRRPAEQEAGKRQAVVIDLTEDDPPVKTEEEEAPPGPAATTAAGYDSRGARRRAGAGQLRGRGRGGVVKPAAARRRPTGRGLEDERRAAGKLVARDCCICGERCEVAAGIYWAAARCPAHRGQ